MTKKENKVIYLLLLLIIAAQVIYMTYTFGCKRVSYHSDEIWSYGLANGDDGPYIYMTDDHVYAKNLLLWTDGEVLRNYVSAETDNRFDYKQVWYNLSKDMHPPLYFAILHTICSLFPGTYSLWYGFAINIVAFIIGQLFLYKTVENMSDSKILGLAGCILWGFCVGAMSVTLFIRHYAMSVMLVMILLFLYSKMMKQKRFSFLKDILPIAVVTYLGTMTNHYFTIFAFFFTGVYCFYFLFTKRYKTLAVYAVTILLSVGLMFLCAPAASTQVAGRIGGNLKKGNYWFQIRSCIYYVMTELFGIETSIYLTMTFAYVEYAIAGILILLLVIAFLSRKERWFQNAVKTGIIRTKKIVLVLFEKAKEFPVDLLAMAVAGTGVLLVTAYMISTPLMGAYTDRYLSVMYPVTSIFFLVLIYKTGSLFIRRRNDRKWAALLIAVSICVVLWNNVFMDSPYEFSMLPTDETYLTNQETSSLLKDSDCILCLTQEWHLEMTPNYLYDVGRFYAFCAGWYEGVQGDLEKTELSDKPMYFVFDGDNIEQWNSYEGVSVTWDEGAKRTYTRTDVEEMIQNLSFVTEYEYVGYTYCFGVKYEIYRIR